MRINGVYKVQTQTVIKTLFMPYLNCFLLMAFLSLVACQTNPANQLSQSSIKSNSSGSSFNIQSINDLIPLPWKKIYVSNDSRVTAMYELKTGENKGDYKKNALQKFQFAKEHNAGKFLYWVNVEPGTDSFTSLMKALTADAKTAKYTNFNPNRDVQYIKDVLPELRSCGY